MNILIICDYCGHQVEDRVYNQSSLSGKSCDKCGDKNLRFKDLDKSKIDYYQGSPPFPEKEKEVSQTDYQDYFWANRSD